MVYMRSFFHKHKSIFLLSTVLASPFIFVWAVVYGAVVGALGGIVWGIQKGRNFLCSKAAHDEALSGLTYTITKWFLVFYIFFFISIIAGLVCLVIGPFRAYGKFVREWKYVWDGTVIRYKKVRIGRKPLVLVVDDEVALAEYVASKIMSTGKYATIMAHNGKEALQALRQNEQLLGISENRIGCIVLDIKMPEMDGIQFLQELRRLEGALMFKIGRAHV